MILKVTFASGTVANVRIKTTLAGKAFRGVVKNALLTLTDKLVTHNSISADDEIVSAVAIRTVPPQSDCMDFVALKGDAACSG